MEKYVCNLELAKKLKELGVNRKEECGFYWRCASQLNPDWVLLYKTSKMFDRNSIYYSAFSVGELGGMLPSYMKPIGIIDDSIERIKTERNGGHYVCYYKQIKKEGNSTITKIIEFSEPFEANARAKMLIYLIENKLIEVKNGTLQGS